MAVVADAMDAVGIIAKVVVLVMRIGVVVTVVVKDAMHVTVVPVAVAVDVKDVVDVAAIALAVVLVPPPQEMLILFFKSLIKRIKIDINMTKLQVLGELL